MKGFPGAKFMSFATRKQAEAASANNYEEFVGCHSDSRKSTPAQLTPSELENHGVVLDSLCVDAACSGNPGDLEYQGVDTRTGEQLFHQGPFEQGTVNIGEFLAIVDALQMLTEQQRPSPVYSDSTTALAWIRKKHCNTKLPRTEINAPLFVLVDGAVAWLLENNYDNHILKWKTGQWGEIPADFGRK